MITLPAFGLAGGRRYNLQLEASITGAVTSYTDTVFLVNQPPSGGTCSVGPLSGIAFQTQFVIACLDWKIWNEFGGALYYEYRIAEKGSRRTFLILEGPTEISDPVEFPVGNIAQNLLNDLHISVIDPVGDEFTVIIDVTVSKLHLKLTQIICFQM